MNATMERALAGAARGDSGLLATFGIERQSVAGAPIPGAGPEGEERFSLTGAGTLAMRRRRSLFDLSSEPVGEFRQQVDRETVMRVIQLIRDARPDELPRTRIGMADMRLRLVITAGGALEETASSPDNAEAIAAAKPLLQDLDRLAASVQQNPERTLRLRLEMPAALRAAKVRLPLTLRFQNEGGEGYWLTHSGALQRAARWERCSLIYGRKPEIQPGFTPPPIQLCEAALEPSEKRELDLFWIGGEAEVEQSLTATLDFGAPGVYLARAVFSSYAGEDHAGGQPRLRGCAFSNETTIEAR